MFWSFIYGTSAILFLLFLRELVLLSRLPKDNSERGLYWFNTFALFLGATFLIGAGFYLDGRKALIESMIVPFPGARFEPHHSILSEDVFIYTTNATAAEVEKFYRTFAGAHALPVFIEEKEGTVAIAVGDAPRVFLAVLERDGRRELHYSLKGEVEITSRVSAPP